MLDKGKPAILLAGFHGGGVREYAWAGEAGNGGRGGAAPTVLGISCYRSQPLPFDSAQGKRAGLTYDAPTARKQRRRSQGRREGTMYCAPTKMPTINVLGQRTGVAAISMRLRPVRLAA